MRNLIAVILLLLLPAVHACKKVIQVDLDDAAPQIVIEGGVTNVPGPTQVTITQTVNFSASNSFPPVQGAAVQITDSNTAQDYSLSEGNPGIYMSQALQGHPGHTYILSVKAGGKSYTASSAMPAPVRLDSVSFVTNVDVNGNASINAVANFQDPPGLGNYYQFIEYNNGKATPDIFVFDDYLSDGRYIREVLYNDTSTLHVGDFLVVDMNCVDATIYNYFFSLFQATSNGFQSAAPANPVSNISNGALGYFSAHTVSSKGLKVY
jgi:hypothetical protein